MGPLYLVFRLSAGSFADIVLNEELALSGNVRAHRQAILATAVAYIALKSIESCLAKRPTTNGERKPARALPALCMWN